MKVELEFLDKEEFTEFVSAYNNALIAYKDIINAINLGCQVSSKWDKLAESKTEEELKHRLFLLQHQYNELCWKEQEIS